MAGAPRAFTAILSAAIQPVGGGRPRRLRSGPAARHPAQHRLVPLDVLGGHSALRETSTPRSSGTRGIDLRAGERTRDKHRLGVDPAPDDRCDVRLRGSLLARALARIPPHTSEVVASLGRAGGARARHAVERVVSRRRRVHRVLRTVGSHRTTTLAARSGVTDPGVEHRLRRRLHASGLRTAAQWSVHLPPRRSRGFPSGARRALAGSFG